ncbi:hypothetical protein H0H93_000731, partial [Arthromyces matolae]
LSKVPTVGGSGVLSSYIGAYRFVNEARDMIQEGYSKYNGAPFKIPDVSRWLVVVSGERYIEELRKAPDDYISFRAQAHDSLQLLYTVGPEIINSYHVDVVRSSLTRNFVERFPDVQDEIVMTFKEYIPSTEGWTSVAALPTIRKIVSRSVNRLFIGLPLCRDPDYRDLNIEFTVDLIKAAQLINLFPNFLKPVAARYLTNVEPQIQRAMRHLRPIIEERLANDIPEETDSSKTHNDLLSWLLGQAPENKRTVRDLTVQILIINFAAIHTTSLAFTQILFDLAQHASVVPDLRREVEDVIKEEGLSKIALHRMVKLDSFIKESQRLGGNRALNVERKVIKDFAFSDGTVIPKGNSIAVPNFAMHHDERNYANANAFDPFRFSKLRELEGKGFSNHQMVALSHDYIVFGLGRHACPGRFFAVNELKALLAHTLLNYDVKFENGDQPYKVWFGLRVAANPKTTVMFRKRSQ